MAAALDTTPLVRKSAGPSEDRRQSDLKPLMELEVCGVVFESEAVPHLFFPEEDHPIEVVPDRTYPKLRSLIDSLRKIHREDDAYRPLVDVLSFIAEFEHTRTSDSGDSSPSDDEDGSDRSSYLATFTHSVDSHESSDASNAMRSQIFFIVYTKQMKNRFDGAGKLKPDGLGTDKKMDKDEAVPWCAVRIAIEVKGVWKEGLRQGLTYARSMLEVGDKWFSMVIVYNHLRHELRFCFATRHAVFLTPKWNLLVPAQFRKVATTLIRACSAVEAKAGFDLHRSLDENGQLHLLLPGMQQSIDCHREICHRIQIIGRATHAYAASFSGDFLPAPRDEVADPPNLSSKLEETGMIHVPLLDLARQSHPTMRVASSPNQRDGKDIPTFPLDTIPHASQPIDMAALPVMPDIVVDFDDPFTLPPDDVLDSVGPSQEPVAAAPSPYPEGSWERLCQEPQLYWVPGAVQEIGPGDFVVKDAWVSHERLDMETDVLKAVDGLFGIVEYAGHMIVSYPGMERLSELRKPPPKRKSYRCKDWPQVYPDGEPKFIPRVHRLIFYKTFGRDLANIGTQPVRIAHAIKDTTAALFLLYSKGYLHRDVSDSNIMSFDKPVKIDKFSRKLDRLKELFGDQYAKIASLFHEQHVFLIDFDHAVKWEVKRKPLHSRSGTWAFMSIDRIKAWIHNMPWIDTLMDDLEGAMWSVCFVVFKANMNIWSEIEKLHFGGFNSDSPYDVATTKAFLLTYEDYDAAGLSALKGTWPLWWRLFRVARANRTAMIGLKKLLRPNQTFANAPKDVKKKLDELCKSAAYNYLEAVREGLEEIRKAKRS